MIGQILKDHTTILRNIQYIPCGTYIYWYRSSWLTTWPYARRNAKIPLEGTAEAGGSKHVCTYNWVPCIHACRRSRAELKLPYHPFIHSFFPSRPRIPVPRLPHSVYYPTRFLRSQVFRTLRPLHAWSASSQHPHHVSILPHRRWVLNLWLTLYLPGFNEEKIWVLPLRPPLKHKWAGGWTHQHTHTPTPAARLFRRLKGYYVWPDFVPSLAAAGQQSIAWHLGFGGGSRFGLHADEHVCYW